MENLQVIESSLSEKHVIEILKKRKHTSQPKSDENIHGLFITLLPELIKAGYELPWITNVEIGNLHVEFGNSIMYRVRASGDRTPVSSTLSELYDEISDSVENNKGYLFELYGKTRGRTYFESCGLEKTHRGMKIPNERDKIVTSIDLLIDSLITHKVGDRIFGTAYWVGIRKKVVDIVGLSTDGASNLSRVAYTKDELRIKLKKIQSSVYFLIKAYHPDDYAVVLREWGFQKERF